MHRQRTYKGIPVSPGISLGKAYIYTRKDIKVNIQLLKNEEEIQDEENNLKKAIELSLKELDKIYKLSLETVGEENSRIFEAQITILNDTFFQDSVIERIRDEKISASYVLNEELTKLSEILNSSGDTFIKERYLDINDIRNRILRNMKREKLVSKVDENSIIVAHEITPADTILFNRRNVKGYVTETGGITSHAAILSRALRVPAVVGMLNITKHILSGDFVIIDGIDGSVIVNPASDTIRIYEEKKEKFLKHEEKLLKVIDLPCETTDKRKVEITSNVEFEEEVDYIASYSHCGIGLYRTEHLYIEKGGFPSLAEQIDEYSHIANIIYPHSVTIRTYDIGGDKLLPSSQKENNPNLGWRGIRITLDRVDIFKTQLEALLISSVKKNIKIMFPMISSLDEVIKAKQILGEVRKSLDAQGKPYDKEIKVGVMIEVPSACMLADDIAKEVDFFSIGTNDLIQFLLAVDRGNTLISKMFQQFHPAVLRAIDKIIKSAHKNNIPVSICGEMASDPIAAIVLIGLGIDELSVVPFKVPEIKQLVRIVEYSRIKILAEELLTYSTETQIRDKLEKFYEEEIRQKLDEE